VKQITPKQAYDFLIGNDIDREVLMGSPERMPALYRAICSVPGNHKMLVQARKYMEATCKALASGATYRKTWYLHQMDKRLVKAFERAQYEAELRGMKGELSRMLKSPKTHQDTQTAAISAAVAKGAAKLAVTKDHLDGKLEMTREQESWVKSVGRGQVRISIG
jgi:hypothetical protein